MLTFEKRSRCKLPKHIEVASTWDGNVGKAVVCRARGLEVTVDHPVEEHGTNLGPTPTELLVMSLTDCFTGALIATAGFLSIPVQKVMINATAEKGEKEFQSIRSIEMAVQLVPEMSDDERFWELIRQAKKNCTISNTLAHPPSIDVLKAGTRVQGELAISSRSSDTT